MNHAPGPTVRERYRRALRGSLLLLALVLIVPLVPYAVAEIDNQIIRTGGIDLWNTIRHDNAGIGATTQVAGLESNVLINVNGDVWRMFRINQMIPWSGGLLLGTLGLIALFFLIRGRIRIDGGRSGKLVPRFSSNQRIVHWFTAGLFVTLGLTGLVLLYGKLVLIPLLGPAGFAVTASACKEIHNLLGPLFPFAIVALAVMFGRGNTFRMIDLKWFLKAGGLFGGHPADSGYYNGGQKSWFWMTVLFGLLISVSGIVLDLPVFGLGRDLMISALLAHGIVAVVFIAASLGHIYIGTLGMEGAVESMTNGYVDANWAREHHNLWFEEMEKAGMVGVEPNALEEVKRHDDIDFKGFGAPQPSDSREG